MARTQSLLPTVLIPLVAGIALTSKAANGQIVPDNTLGEESSTVRQDVIKDVDSDIIEGGATRDANLFHSFTDFNVEAGRGDYFANVYKSGNGNSQRQHNIRRCNQNRILSISSQIVQFVFLS